MCILIEYKSTIRVGKRGREQGKRRKEGRKWKEGRKEMEWNLKALERKVENELL